MTKSYPTNWKSGRTLNFGSYSSGQKDVWLEEVSSGGDTPTPTTYTITFDAGNGTFVGNTDFPNTSNTKAAGTYTLPSATPASGYTFNGWTTATNNTSVTGSYTVSGNVDFTASYSQNSSGGGGDGATHTYNFAGANNFYTDANLNTHPSSGNSNNVETIYYSDGKSFTASGASRYFSSASSGYFMLGKANATISLPTFDGYKITQVKLHSSTGHSTSVAVSIISGSNTASAAQTWSTKDNDYVYDVASNYQSSSLSVKVTNAYNTQFTSITLVCEEATPSTDPVINVTTPDVLAYDATNGSITYSITNPVTGGQVTAAKSSEANWLTLANATETTIPFTCSANETASNRSATVTLTYTYGDNQTATKSVTITQAGNPNIVPTIAEVRAQGTGSVVTKGIVTSCVGTTGYIQDATAAICVYGSALTVGDEVKVSGTLTTYKGLLEITSPTVEVLSSENTVTTTVKTIAEINSDYNGNNALQGWLVKIEEATVTNIDGKNVTLSQGDNSIIVRFNNESDITFAQNDIVTLTGNIGCFDAAQIANPTNVTVKQNENPYITADNVEIEYNATSGAIAYTIENPATNGSLSASTEAEWITMGNATGQAVSFTCEANNTANSRSATVTLTYTYNNTETVTKDVTVAQAGNPNIVATIAEVRAQGTGDVVTKGIVTSVNAKTAYMQDENAAIVIYGSSNLTVNVGAEVKVEGTLKNYNGLLEITSPAITTLSQNNNVSPEVMTIADVNASTNQGWLVKIEEATVTTISEQNVTIAQGESTIVVRFNSTNDVTFSENDIISLTGNIGCNNNTVQIANPTDIIVKENEEPTINASNVTLEYDATSGVIDYTITNPAESVTLQATADADWISDITVGESAVTFTTTANEGEADRTATFTLTYTGAEDKTVTVTQKHFEVDYATLPFEYDGGKSNLPTGLTASGLGSDYGSSPKLKFDGTGDYMILKINEHPGTLTFDIKGNGFSGSTFKVQTSEDGVTYTDLETYTELGDTQNETFENLDENVRYIKWIYTEKVNGNVALGNIKLEKFSADPAITVDPDEVDVDADKHDGTLAIAYKNLQINAMTDFDIQFYDAEGEEVNDPEWIEVTVAQEDPTVGEGYVVSYYMVENENAEEGRTAYFKVYALDGNDFVYSNLVTITQAKYVVNYATLPFEWDDTTTPTGVTNDGVGTYPNSPYQKFDDTGDNIVLKINEAPSALAFDIKNNNFSGGSFTVQTSANGTDFTNLAEYTELTGTQTEVFTDLNSEIRYIKWIYTNKNKGNVALGNIKVYNSEYVETVTTANFAASGYASFCSPLPLDLTPTEDYAAWAVTNVEGTEVTFTKIEGAVPAGTPFILYGQNFGGQTATLPIATGETTAIADNMLKGTLKETEVSTVEGDYTNFGLSGGKFVKIKDGVVKANKAYLPILTKNVPEGARLNIVFADEATGIKVIDDSQFTIDNAFFDLQGRRIQQPTKGLYIKQGKKLYVK